MSGEVTEVLPRHLGLAPAASLKAAARGGLVFHFAPIGGARRSHFWPVVTTACSRRGKSAGMAARAWLFWLRLVKWVSLAAIEG
jgi:hypothetical protein